MSTTAHIAGIYPQIVHRDPNQTGNGKDNLGMGYTQHGEQFMLKNGGTVGVAEFVGAKVSDACGIPACQPTVVTIEDLSGPREVFGSRIESGRVEFIQTDVASWKTVMGLCANPQVFSAMLAVDLVLGNDDRHWNNWIVQEVKDPAGASRARLRALDFSRSWPVRHPAQHPLHHRDPNTWTSAKDWGLLGIDFDLSVFHETCARIGRLNAAWLHSAVMQPITGVFVSHTEVSTFCDWWDKSLRDQVILTIQAMETGV